MKQSIKKHQWSKGHGERREQGGQLELQNLRESKTMVARVGDKEVSEARDARQCCCADPNGIHKEEGWSRTAPEKIDVFMP